MTESRKYKQFSQDERIAWGLKEDALRAKDLEAINGPADLAVAQASAKKRRLRIGATARQAIGMILEGRTAARLRAQRAALDAAGEGKP